VGEHGGVLRRGECSQWGHYFRVQLLRGWGTHIMRIFMRIFGCLGLLIAWLLAPVPMVVAAEDTTAVQAAAPSGTPSHPVEEEGDDFLNIWD
jgi:hypothetical protein